MIKRHLHILYGLNASIILLLSPFCYSLETIALITGSHDLKESSLGSEMYCISYGLSKKYKHKFNFLLLNNERTLEGTLSNIEQIKKLNIKTVIGAANSVEAKPLSDNSKHFRYISPLATNPNLLNKTTFLFNTSDKVIVNKISRKISQINNKKIGIITNISSNYSRYLSNQIKTSLSKKIKIMQFKFIEGSNNRNSFLEFIKKNNIKTIFFPLHASRASFFYNELKKLHKKFTIFGADGIGGRPRFIQSISPTSQNITFFYVKSWKGLPFTKSPFFKEFDLLRREYCKKKTASMVMTFMYDAIKSYIMNNSTNITNPYFGVSGIHKYIDNVSNRAIFMYQIANNKSVFLGPL